MSRVNFFLVSLQWTIPRFNFHDQTHELHPANVTYAGFGLTSAVEPLYGYMWKLTELKTIKKKCLTFLQNSMVCNNQVTKATKELVIRKSTVLTSDVLACGFSCMNTGLSLIEKN